MGNYNRDIGGKTMPTIQNQINLYVDINGQFVSGSMPTNVLYRNNLNRNIFFICTPLSNATIVEVIFRNSTLSNNGESQFARATGQKAESITDKSVSYYEKVKDWNVYVLIPSSRLLSKFPSSMSGTILGTIRLTEIDLTDLLGVPPLNYLVMWPETNPFDMTTGEAQYIVSRSQNLQLPSDILGGAVLNFNDILIFDGVDTYTIRRALWSRSSTEPLRFVGNPALIDEDFDYDDIPTTVTQNIYAQLSSHEIDLANLWRELDLIGSITAGPEGPEGPMGPQGPAGPQGPTGQNGQDGISGFISDEVTDASELPPTANIGTMIIINNGVTYDLAIFMVDNTWHIVPNWGGIQGPPGPEGPSGPTGSQGASGIQGVQGPPGLQGIAGPRGPDGMMGPMGPAGAAGVSGPPGLTGQTGPVGPQGPQGLQGAQGPIGPEGAQGIAGPGGPAGPIGLQGPQGFQGDPGLDGPMGPQGIPGPQGPIGETGIANINPMGIWDSSTTYNQNDLVISPISNNAYILIAPSLTGGVDPSTDTTNWMQFVSAGAQGPVGPQGPQGDNGPQGVQGIQGPQGPQGLVGNDGPVGPPGSMGPAGPIGPTGLQGPLGPPGPQGDPGAIGPEGPAGPQGVQGNQGPTGPAGPVGPQGNPGPAGPAGPDAALNPNVFMLRGTIPLWYNFNGTVNLGDGSASSYWANLRPGVYQRNWADGSNFPGSNVVVTNEWDGILIWFGAPSQLAIYRSRANLGAIFIASTVDGANNNNNTQWRSISLSNTAGPPAPTVTGAQCWFPSGQLTPMIRFTVNNPMTAPLRVIVNGVTQIIGSRTSMLFDNVPAQNAGGGGATVTFPWNWLGQESGNLTATANNCIIQP